ncbi:PAS domain-containing protein [Tepidicaulis sp. LMO-SS28]|uniref:PAS domain-containing protein n=1 Tax=Tepidicaulis sp. LMO-SS28 TaxID=3447455 RepID=UPI003EE36A82
MILAPLMPEHIPDRHPVARYADYHKERAQQDGVLRRQDFDPIEIPRIIPWMLILEQTEIEGRIEFLYRLAGTGCREIFGIDYTGKILGEDLPADAAAERRREIIEVLDEKQPRYTRTQIPIAGREFITILRGVFPVSRKSGADCVHIIIAPEKIQLAK